MKDFIFYIPGGSPALRYAAEYLADRGITLSSAPDSNVTHLLLPAPAFDGKGLLRGGGDAERILSRLSETVTVLGGRLNHPALSRYKTVDLLQDEGYLAENAAITADCALRIAGSNLGTVFRHCPVLVIGWGRIGKCLAQLLGAVGADVTVAARKESARAMAQALGYRAVPTDGLHFGLMRYRVIFNTVPAPVLSEEQTDMCRADCIKIDLASSVGISGSDVIWARGLPGKDTPEASGILIGKTVIRLISGREAAL